MWERLNERWLPRVLFLLTLGLAALLVALALLAPLIEAESSLLRLFAEDATVRRTSWFCAAGLAVTAFVFFRPTGVFRRKKGSRPTPPSTMAGACTGFAKYVANWVRWANAY